LGLNGGATGAAEGGDYGIEVGMEQDARLDAESGLYPQKMLESLLNGELLRAQRYASPIALLYIGLCFNESPSPEIMESAHSYLTNIIHTGLREVDMPGHYQGNYLIVMPESDAGGARKAAQRLVDKFQGKQVTRELNEYGVSICAGVACHLGGAGITADELLSRASSALWEAHRRGPRTLVVFDELKDRHNKTQ
jgi:diguanylate cyclase (GGDEF)-like protein